MSNNTCYSQKFYIDEVQDMEVTRGKFDRLKAGLDRMNKDINHSNSIREYVIE